MSSTTAFPLPELTPEELSRYSRHLILPEVGMEGQRKLKAARVLCIGTGGLGSPLALYLAAAGMGTLGLVDFDVVDASNLQRQIIHSTRDIGRKKLDSAEEKLTALNPGLNVVKHETMLTSANALEILADYDIVADGTDNFPTRYLVNDACVLLGQAERVRHPSSASKARPAFSACRRAVLPLPLSRTAAARAGAQLRGGRSAGHSSRAGRRHPGHRGHQADPRQGRAAGRAPAARRCARHALPRAQAAQESRVPGLRRASHRDQADRLPTVLRHQTSDPGAESDQRNSADERAGAEAAARRRRRPLYPRRARAVRVPDCQYRRQARSP